MRVRAMEQSTRRMPMSLIFRLVGFAFLAWVGNAEAVTRVALVRGEGSANGSLVELALTKLSNDEDLQLLERDEIRRILDEQKLTITGVVDANSAIKVGTILSVDLFAVVDGAPGSDTTPGIVVFDAKTGVRYWDSALPSASELEQAADAVVLALRSASRKRDRRNEGLHTVGFVSVRNADLPRQQDGLCETIGLLVERSLPRSPDLAVLERRRLARVNEERSLSSGGNVADLVASLTTVELEISRDPAGKGLKATAILKLTGQTAAEQLIVSIPDVNGAELAESLSRKLIERLHAAPAVGTSDRRNEAKRFDFEAGHHFSHQRMADAVRAEEAAYALDSSNEKYGERLSLYLVRNATYMFSPTESTVTKGGDQAWADARVEPAVLDSIFAAAHRSLEILSNRPLTSAHPLFYNMALMSLCDRLRGLHQSSSGPSRRQIEELLEMCRRRSLDYCAEWAAKTAADPNWHDGYTSAAHSQIGLIKSASLDTRQYAECMSQLASRWVEVTKETSPRFTRTDGGEILNMLLHAFVKPTIWPWPVEEHAYASKMAPIYAAMQQHGRPIVRLYGHCGQIRGNILLNAGSEEEAHARFASTYRPLAQSIIVSPAPWDPARSRAAAYEAWRTAIEDFPGSKKAGFATREVLELCGFMIRRNELVYKVLQQAFWQLDAPLSLDLIRQALPVVGSPLFDAEDAEKARLRSLLKTTEQEVISKHPELAATPHVLPWTNATRIFDNSSFTGLGELAGCVLTDGCVFGFCLQFDEGRIGLRLVRVPLPNGAQSGHAAELLGRCDLRIPSGELPAHSRHRLVSNACVNGGSIYVATRGAGIIVFPFKDGVSRQISLAEGLPSTNVRSVAVLEDNLYAGFDDGYLIRYNLKSGRCDILASSRRKQRLSPFDDGDVFRVPTLISDPARQRVVFVIGRHVWELTTDGVMSPIMDLVSIAQGRSEPKLTGETINWSSPRRGDRVLVSNAFHAMELDLSRDQGTEIQAPRFGVFPTYPPHLVLDGWLWSGSSFSRLSLDERRYQSLPHPDKTSTPFRPEACLEFTADGTRLIAADDRSVWLLELAGNKSSDAERRKTSIQR